MAKYLIAMAVVDTKKNDDDDDEAFVYVISKTWMAEGYPRKRSKKHHDYWNIRCRLQRYTIFNLMTLCDVKDILRIVCYRMCKIFNWWLQRQKKFFLINMWIYLIHTFLFLFPLESIHTYTIHIILLKNRFILIICAIKCSKWKKNSII